MNTTPRIVEVVWWVDGTVEELREEFQREPISIDTQFPPCGYTLMHYAARSDWPMVDGGRADGRLEYLLAMNPDLEIRSLSLNSWMDGLDWTVLLMASWFGTIDKIPPLIEAGAKLDAQDELGRTALMYAQHTFDAPARGEMLLRFGADETITDNDGWSYLAHRREAIELLSAAKREGLIE